MARGKAWPEEEVSILMAMVSQGISLQQIYDSGKLPGRTFEAIKRQLRMAKTLSSLVTTKPASIVATIEPATDALKVEEVIKLFSTAFKQICEATEIDKLLLERFRIIFQAAKDYGPLLSHYEKWEQIERQIEQLSATVAELQAAKGLKET